MQPLSFANTDGFLHFYSGSFTETRTKRRDKRSCKTKNRGIPEPQSGTPLLSSVNLFSAVCDRFDLDKRCLWKSSYFKCSSGRACTLEKGCVHFVHSAEVADVL